MYARQRTQMDRPLGVWHLLEQVQLGQWYLDPHRRTFCRRPSACVAVASPREALLRASILDELTFTESRGF